MIINGATVDDSLVPELARAIKNTKLAHKLVTAHRFRTELINLNHTERTLILAALNDDFEGLKELRAQLSSIQRGVRRRESSDPAGVPPPRPNPRRRLGLAASPRGVSAPCCSVSTSAECGTVSSSSATERRRPAWLSRIG